jgi:hypothetical protein
MEIYEISIIDLIANEYCTNNSYDAANMSKYEEGTGNRGGYKKKTV